MNREYLEQFRQDLLKNKELREELGTRHFEVVDKFMCLFTGKDEISYENEKQPNKFDLLEI